MVQEGRDAGRGGQEAVGSPGNSTNVQARRNLARAGLWSQLELAGRPGPCLGTREEHKEDQEAASIGAIAPFPPSARGGEGAPYQPIADPTFAEGGLPDLGRVRPVLDQCSLPYDNPPQHLAEVNEGWCECVTSSSASGSEKEQRAAEEAAWQQSAMGKSTATLQVENQEDLPEGQGQEQAVRELGRPDSQGYKLVSWWPQEEEAEGKEANSRTEAAYRKRHPESGRPSPLAAWAGCGAGSCPTGGSSAGHGPSATAFGERGTRGEGREGVEPGPAPPKPGPEVPGSNDERGVEAILTPTGPRPRRGKKPKPRCQPTVVDPFGSDWPELPEAAEGVLCSAPNKSNATVVGTPCPTVSMRSQQGVGCNTLPGENGARPHFAKRSTCSSKIVSVQAELKLRELKVSFAVQLQLIREKFNLPCAELAIQRVAEFDLRHADVASLEESIQIAKQILLD